MAKKLLCLATAVVVTVLVLVTGCGQKTETKSAAPAAAAPAETKAPEKKADKVKIIFWDENAGPNRTPFYEELIKKFHEKNADVEVEYVGVPAASAKQKYDTAIAAGEVPDCAGMPPLWTSNFVAKDAIVALDPYFDKWSEKAKIAPNIVDSIRSINTDKKLYTLPNTSNMTTLWYRADWYKEAGIAEPKTWDELFKAIEKTTDKDKKRFGFSIRGGAGGPSQLVEYLYPYSGLTEFFDANGKSTIDNPKHVEALKRLAALYNKYTPESDIANGYKEMVAAFDTGAAGMIQHNLGSYGEHSKTLGEGKFAAIAMPKAATGSRVTIGGSTVNGYGMFKNSKKPDAAWKFISFLCTNDSQSYWNQNIGQMPTHLDVMNQEWVKKAQHINMALSTIGDKDTKVIVPPLYLPDYNTIQDKIVMPGFQSVLAGKKPAEELLKEWADALTKSKAEYDKANKK